MICGACHLRADRVDARLFIPAYREKKIDSLFHSRYKVQSQSNKLESLNRAICDLIFFFFKLRKINSHKLSFHFTILK